MNRTLDLRLRKIETAGGNTAKRMVWIDADTVAERRDRIGHLIESGAAAPTDTFISWEAADEPRAR
jgi:hypothetical protein